MEECLRLLKALSDYIDEEIAPEVCSELESHLEGCSSCQILLKTTKQTITYYRETHTHHIPSYIRIRLRRRLNIEWTSTDSFED